MLGETNPLTALVDAGTGFHENVIRQRGIHAQLVQVPVVSGRCVYRHLHPYELALLNGMLPPAAWHEPDCQNLRLSLSAVQSAWVGACVVQQLQHYLGLPQCNTVELLGNFNTSLFEYARQMFPNVTASVPAAGWVRPVYPDGKSTQVQVSATSTLL